MQMDEYPVKVPGHVAAGTCARYHYEQMRTIAALACVYQIFNRSPVYSCRMTVVLPGAVGHGGPPVASGKQSDL